MYSKENFGLTIKLLRIEKNKKQIEFSNILEVEQGTVSKIENGQLELSAAQLYMLLDHFKMSANEFKGFLKYHYKKSNKNITEEYVEKTLKEQREANKKGKKITKLKRA